MKFGKRLLSVAALIAAVWLPLAARGKQQQAASASTVARPSRLTRDAHRHRAHCRWNRDSRRERHDHKHADQPKVAHVVG